MTAKRRICVVTGSRADYGLLYWVMKGIVSSNRPSRAGRAGAGGAAGTAGLEPKLPAPRSVRPLVFCTASGKVVTAPTSAPALS